MKHDKLGAGVPGRSTAWWWPSPTLQVFLGVALPFFCMGIVTSFLTGSFVQFSHSYMSEDGGESARPPAPPSSENLEAALNLAREQHSFFATSGGLVGAWEGGMGEEGCQQRGGQGGGSRSEEPGGPLLDWGRESYVGQAEVPPPLPRLVYYVGASAGDVGKLIRMLKAIYHPRNHYLLNLDEKAAMADREVLVRWFTEDPIINRFKNVRLIELANPVTYRGPSMIAATLHAMAIMLHDVADWDWFINLSASDYPLVTQDELLLAFSYVPRHVNFVEASTDIRRVRHERTTRVILDHGLYSANHSWEYSPILRSIPTRFQIYQGSAWMFTTREFVHYLLLGYENLPRLALMYFSNYLSSPEGYFQTVVCNAPRFRGAVVNSDLHHIEWPTKKNRTLWMELGKLRKRSHPLSLTAEKWDDLLASGAAFARKFPENDPVLDRIDQELLGVGETGFVPGAWCEDPDCRGVEGPQDRARPAANMERFMQKFRQLMKKSSFSKEVSCGGRWSSAPDARGP